MSELHQYGIMQEKSDTRAHVCAVVQRVYVFDTQAAREVIRNGSYPVREASQTGVNGTTATGWLVPPEDIPACVALKPRSQTWEYLDFSERHSTSHRGREAMRLVVGLIKNGMFPFPAQPTDHLHVDIDMEGKDIRAHVAEQTRYIQVKCDRRGGAQELGGTGNLFLQKAERNPFGRHDGEQKALF